MARPKARVDERIARECNERLRRLDRQIAGLKTERKQVVALGHALNGRK